MRREKAKSFSLPLLPILFFAYSPSSDHPLIPTLVSRVTTAWRENAEKSEYGGLCYNICMGMLNAADRNSQHIDLILRQYFAVADQVAAFRDAPEAWHQGLIGQLKMQAVENMHNAFLDRDEQLRYMYKDPPGRNDAVDKNYVNEMQQGVEERFDEVREVFNEYVMSEKTIIVQQALAGRWMAISYSGVCKEMAPYLGPGFLRDKGITDALVKGPRSCCWDKVRFIGTLLRVRAMAKSLFEMPAKELSLSKEERVKSLKRWLWDPELNPTNDRVLTQHVLFTLNNLIDGPFDESR